MWLLRRAFESSSLVMSARHSSRLKCVCELCSFIQAHSCRPLVRLSFSITCVYRHKIRKRKAALFPLRVACGGVFALSCCCPAAARSCRRLVSSWLCSCAVLAWLFPSVPWPLPPAQADVVMPEGAWLMSGGWLSRPGLRSAPCMRMRRQARAPVWFQLQAHSAAAADVACRGWGLGSAAAI
jgi:hypothetical protein